MRDMIDLYVDNGTSQQSHSEFKAYMDVQQLAWKSYCPLNLFRRQRNLQTCRFIVGSSPETALAKAQ